MRVLRILALSSVALLSFGSAALGDDTDLLRFDTAKPYVFFLLDTSTSMGLDLDNGWVHANGDDPRSKLYLAKEVLYDVLSPVQDVQFGFATFNQDQLAVQAKHWLYFVRDVEANHAAIASLGLGYPAVEPADRVDEPVLDGDGNPTGDITVGVDGDLLTLGRGFGVPGGTCSAPLDLGRERERINRYAKLGTDGTTATDVWVSDGSRTHRLTFDDTGSGNLGAATVTIRLRARELDRGRNACTAGTDGGPSFRSDQEVSLVLGRYRSFLMWDDTSSEVFLVPGLTQNKNKEDTGGLWDWHDIQGSYHCGDDKPFSGQGWEGNYDTGPLAPDPSLEVGSDPAKLDTVCEGGDCQTLKRLTVRSTTPDERELDRGDFLPFHWEISNKEEFLRRINPRHGSGGRAFGAAEFFTDQPAVGSTLLGLRDPAQRPLIPAGISPLSDAIVDFRCWYLADATNKCRVLDDRYRKGFVRLAAENDLEWLCRKPYLIVVTDGENNCSGENPTADVANLFSQALVRTWVVNLGASNPGVINSITRPGQGEEVTVETKQALRDELQRILGTIREEARAFASAAVPSVQADVADKLYLTRFTPLNESAVWAGHVDAFLKPLPQDQDTGVPDTDHPNHLWDAGEVLRDAQAPERAEIPFPTTAAGLRAGFAANQRRIVYPLDPATQSPGVPLSTRLLVSPSDEVSRLDLWRGLGVVDQSFDGGGSADLEADFPTEAARFHQLMADTYAIREAEVTNADGSTESIRYVLGDVFHADPLIVSDPPNVRYFVDEVRFPGYRDFATKHDHRRRMLAVGANDGLLHIFDAGQFEVEVEDGRLVGRFGAGTGRELFAYLPRALMPKLQLMAPPSTVHQWGVDGTPRAADVRIDVRHTGTPDPDDREWRTILVGGLRRGGAAYYALDITQPDSLHREQHTDPATGTVTEIDFVPQSDRVVPDCSEGTGNGNDYGCDDEVRFPATLWEWSDPSDDDANGAADLGETWSVPNVGAVRFLRPGPGGVPTEELRYVSIFGGGRDPQGLRTGGSGNWIYMVDVETGKTIYKRVLVGSAPSEPAAVDVDQDGVLDRVYIGTTAGLVYRIDLEPPAMLTASGSDLRVDPGDWDPYVVFDTVTRNGSEYVRRPIFFRPSVFYVAALGRYGLAFGTGQRDELFTRSPVGGNRIYVLVDDDLGPAAQPRTEEDLATVLAPDPLGAESDLLVNRPLGQRGWVLTLDGENERLITPVFTIAGVTLWSTFLPQICDPDVAGSCIEPREGGRCAKRGDSRIYLTLTSSAAGVFTDQFGLRTRYQTVEGAFLTEPFAEQFQTGNPRPPGGDDDTTTFGFDLTDQHRAVMEAIKKLFPPNCRYGNYRFDLKTIRSDTRMVFIAPVPVCIVQKNWKEY